MGSIGQTSCNQKISDKSSFKRITSSVAVVECIDTVCKNLHIFKFSTDGKTREFNYKKVASLQKGCFFHFYGKNVL